jgi:hypothetical protein
VITPTLPSPLEVQRRVAQAIGRSSYSSPPTQLLPMLPNEGTKKFVSHYLLDTSCLLCFFVVKSIFSDALYSS